MSTDPNDKSSGDPFQDFIEARYAEWEDEFGDEVDARRTISFEAKK